MTDSTPWPIVTAAQKATVIACLTEMYDKARDNYWACAEQLSEALGYPSMDMLSTDQVRERLQELIA